MSIDNQNNSMYIYTFCEMFSFSVTIHASKMRVTAVRYCCDEVGGQNSNGLFFVENRMS